MFLIALIALIIVVALCWFRLPESSAYLRSQGRTDEAAAVEARYGLVPAPEPERAERPGFGTLLAHRQHQRRPLVSVGGDMGRSLQLSDQGIAAICHPRERDQGTDRADRAGADPRIILGEKGSGGIPSAGAAARMSTIT
jgi:hypothetical protein